MRIAYFSDNFYPELSGISDSIITTGEELRKRGHDVVYVAPHYPAGAYKGNTHPEKDALTVKRLPSIGVPNSPTGQSRFAIPFGASIPFLKKFKPDIIHTQSPYGVGLEALLASRLLRVPLVGTNHTPIEEFVAYIPVGEFLAPLARRYDAFYYNRCRFVTAPYQGLLDAMRTVGFKKPGKGQANPVPPVPQLQKDEVRAAYKNKMTIDGPVVLVSGRLAPEKCVDVVIEAFAKVRTHIPNAHLIITGRGAAEADLRQLAKDCGVAEQVRFVGFVGAAELAELYCASDLYVIMSTAETQSLSLMQAYAHGVPAIAARSRGLVDYTPEECGFLVEPGNIEELAERMEQLLRSPSLRQSMGEKGKTFVEQFTPARIADAWEDIYARVVSP